MNTEEKNRIKKILSDPIMYYASQIHNNPKEIPGKLYQTWQEYLSVKDKFLTVDNKTKELSREIGAYKKADEDCSELLLIIQRHSKDKQILNKQLQDLEEEILSYFIAMDKTITQNNSTTDNSSTHYYPDKTVDLAKITIQLLGNDFQPWNGYLKESKSATIYHMAEWRNLIKKTFGHESYYFYATDENEIVKGILPLVRLNSKLFGDFIVSMPYFNYGGAIADHPEIENMLMTAAAELASKLNVTHIEFRDDISRENYPVRTDKVNMVLSLPTDKEELWNNFTPKLRAQIKRPQRENPGISHGHIELLDDFYAVFARNMRDLGTPVYDKSFFSNILESFQDQSCIFTIKIGKKPIAAAFLLGYGNTLEIPWASTLREYNHLGINMLMYWEILSYAIENNFNYFDFGRSSKESGTYRFKKQWGAEPKQSYWHYWLPTGGTMPSLNPNNPKFKLVIGLWKRLPLFITNIIGPKIVKNLP